MWSGLLCAKTQINPSALAITDAGDSDGLRSCVLISLQVKVKTSVLTDSKDAAHFATLQSFRR